MRDKGGKGSLGGSDGVRQEIHGDTSMQGWCRAGYGNGTGRAVKLWAGYEEDRMETRVDAV